MNMCNDQPIDQAPARTVRRDVATASSTRDVVYDAHGDPASSSTVTRQMTPRGYDESITTDLREGYFDAHLSRVTAGIFAVFAIIEGLIGVRFALFAFGARRSSAFVDFIYDVSWPFVRPFSGAFRNRTWDQGIVEVSSLLAMGVILLLFLLVSYLIATFVPRHDTTAATVRRERVTHV